MTIEAARIYVHRLIVPFPSASIITYFLKRARKLLCNQYLSHYVAGLALQRLSQIWFGGNGGRSSLAGGSVSDWLHCSTSSSSSTVEGNSTVRVLYRSFQLGWERHAIYKDVCRATSRRGFGGVFFKNIQIDFNSLWGPKG